MTARRTLGILCGLTLLVGGLAPAGLVTGQLAEACAGQCRFAETSGYWWRGASELYLRDAGPYPNWRSLGRIAWSLGTGGLRLEVGQGWLSLNVGREGWQLAADNLDLPAASLLGRVGHGLPRDGWGGRLIARQVSIALPWSLGRASGVGEIAWRQAQTSLLENYPLGDYRVNWTLSPEGRWQGQIQGGEGLRLVGEASAQPFRFNGTADIDERAGVLKKYLLTVGQAAGEHSYRLAFPVAGGT